MKPSEKIRLIAQARVEASNCYGRANIIDAIVDSAIMQVLDEEVAALYAALAELRGDKK